jgi:hypothetical protein
VAAETGGAPEWTRGIQTMRLEIRTDGVDFVVSREPLPKLDMDGRQKADRDTGELLFTTELVAMDESGAEVIKVTTGGAPRVSKRHAVSVRGLVATPWNMDGRGGVAFRADAITPVTASAPAGTAATKAGA